jgi:hypothetical protein
MSFNRYEAPKEKHPSSIMNLSNTGGHGRGGQQGSIIGDVINHGKKQFWGRQNVHYHQGMQAGENTLNALCARYLFHSFPGLWCDCIGVDSDSEPMVDYFHLIDNTSILAFH